MWIIDVEVEVEVEVEFDDAFSAVSSVGVGVGDGDGGNNDAGGIMIGPDCGSECEREKMLVWFDLAPCLCLCLCICFCVCGCLCDEVELNSSRLGTSRLRKPVLHTDRQTDRETILA
jgi:hypothetical protein